MVESANPFVAASTLPYQLPPFSEIAEAHYRPAFELGFAEQLAEISAITATTDAPTFDNTMVPLERSGRILDRVAAVFFTRTSSDSSDFTNALEAELAPLLAAHADSIRLDPVLYARVSVLHDARSSLGLTS